MSDVLLVCGKCKRECKVSEFASPDTLCCPTCKTLLQLPEKVQATKLRMRKPEEPVTTDGKTAAPPSTIITTLTTAPAPETTPSTAQTPMVINDVHKIRQNVKGQNPLWGILIFLLVGGALIGWQYYVGENPGSMKPYLLTRLTLFSIIQLVIILLAFDDGLGQGILCLLLPFYFLYYIFVRYENLTLRGLFAAVYLAMATELYFIPEQALVTTIQQNINEFIVYVEHLIKRASDPVL